MASAFDVSALTAYVKENEDLLISTIVTGAPTLQILRAEGNIQTGIKTTEKIGVFDTDATWQEGDGCGFTPLGSADISQREITVGNIKINMEFCMDDLVGFYTQEMLRQAELEVREDLGPWESRIIDRMTAKQNRDMEIALWKGDTASGNDKLQHFDGFIKLIDGAQSAVYSNSTTGTGTVATSTASTGVTGTGTAFTTQGIAAGDKIYAGGTFIGTVASVGSNTAITLTGNAAATKSGAAFYFVTAANAAATTTGNIITRVDALYGSIPEAVLSSENARLWVGADEARTYLRALTTANMFHFTSEGNMLRDGFVLPGTDLRVTPTPGLSGTGRRYVINPENMWYGTDLENSYERFKIWYDENTEMIRLKARWRAGVQIGFPEEVTASF